MQQNVQPEPGMPFFDLFSRVRAAGILLVKEDYFDLLKAMKAQFGMDQERPDDARAQEAQFVQLAKFIWTRSADEEARFDQAWAESKQYIQRQIAQEAGQGDNEIFRPGDMGANRDQSKPEKATEAKPKELTDNQLKIRDTELENEEGDMPLPVVDHQKESAPYQPVQRWFNIGPDCYDLTLRQMYQGWRKLDRPTKVGFTEQIDLPQTIQNTAKTGMFLGPAFLPDLQNTTRLLILADSQGSMLPFHGLTEQIIRAAEKEGGMKSVTHYFFLNYPEKNMYLNPEQTRFVGRRESLDKTLAEQRPTVLIISDAGAARGYFNPDRVAATNLFINHLQQYCGRRIAWLNPMPRARWQGNSAQYIAKNIAMFEAVSSGFRAAVDHLK